MATKCWLLWLVCCGWFVVVGLLVGGLFVGWLLVSCWLMVVVGCGGCGGCGADQVYDECLYR